VPRVRHGDVVSAPDFPDQPDPVAEADQLGAALRLFARMQGG
jgi:hypothetical protein